MSFTINYSNNRSNVTHCREVLLSIVRKGSIKPESITTYTDKSGEKLIKVGLEFHPTAKLELGHYYVKLLNPNDFHPAELHTLLGILRGGVGNKNTQIDKILTLTLKYLRENVEVKEPESYNGAWSYVFNAVSALDLYLAIQWAFKQLPKRVLYTSGYIQNTFLAPPNIILEEPKCVRCGEGILYRVSVSQAFAGGPCINKLHGIFSIHSPRVLFWEHKNHKYYISAPTAAVIRHQAGLRDINLMEINK